MPLNTAQRETYEEVGIKLHEQNFSFQEIFVQKMILPNGNLNNDLGYLYFVDWTNREDSFTIQPEEVVSLQWFSLSELQEKFSQMKKPIDFVPR